MRCCTYALSRSRGKVPEPAEPFDLDVNDSYTTVPGLPTSLGQVLDQDTTNLAAPDPWL